MAYRWFPGGPEWHHDPCLQTSAVGGGQLETAVVPVQVPEAGACVGQPDTLLWPGDSVAKAIAIIDHTQHELAIPLMGGNAEQPGPFAWFDAVSNRIFN